MFTEKEKEFINRLEKRLRFLGIRVAEGKDKGKDLSYDAAEAAALNWALGRINGTKVQQ